MTDCIYVSERLYPNKRGSHYHHACSLTTETLCGIRRNLLIDVDGNPIVLHGHWVYGDDFCARCRDALVKLDFGQRPVRWKKPWPWTWALVGNRTGYTAKPGY